MSNKDVRDLVVRPTCAVLDESGRPKYREGETIPLAEHKAVLETQFWKVHWRPRPTAVPAASTAVEAPAEAPAEAAAAPFVPSGKR